MKRVLLGATVLSTALMLTQLPAVAADLGGDCCADLEERVAELETTTVRKGNRRVSVTLYGQVNQALMFFDNGDDNDVYVVDNDLSSTRFGFKGKAKIGDGWSAGFKIEIEAQTANSDDVEQNDDDDGSNFIAIRKAEWYLKNKALGKITVGQGSQAIDGIMTIDLSGSNVIDHGQLVDIGEDIHFGSTGIDVENIIDDLDGSRINRVRYDSPTFAGFLFSASWGEDDSWDVALRYAAEFNGLRFAAGVGYGWSNDEQGPDETTEKLLFAASILHRPTGLFLTGTYGEQEFDDGTAVASRSNHTEEQFYVKGGISRKFSSLGKTVLYVSYAEHDNSENRGLTGVRYGAGVVQKIDAAAMELYLGYRHFEVEDGVAAFGADYGDIDIVTAGARIKF